MVIRRVSDACLHSGLSPWAMHRLRTLTSKEDPCTKTRITRSAYAIETNCPTPSLALRLPTFSYVLCCRKHFQNSDFRTKPQLLKKRTCCPTTAPPTRTSSSPMSFADLCTCWRRFHRETSSSEGVSQSARGPKGREIQRSASKCTL